MKYGVTIVLTMMVAVNSSVVRMKCSRVVGSFYTTTTDDNSGKSSINQSVNKVAQVTSCNHKHHTEKQLIYMTRPG